MRIVSHPSYTPFHLIPLADYATVEMILLEAAHRLHFDYGIELERIDEANVLPLNLLGGSGLIHKASQRYFYIRGV